jgi:hypothetical protein
MNSRKPKQDVEYLIEWETRLQPVEAVPTAVEPRPRWEADSELIVELGSNKPRSRLH